VVTSGWALPASGRSEAPLAGGKRVFDNGWVRVELDQMRRSVAIGGQLTRSDVEVLLDTCDRLLAEREEIAAILRDLGPAWTDARAALNKLAKVVQR
jgi:hypothetical protein